MNSLKKIVFILLCFVSIYLMTSRSAKTSIYSDAEISQARQEAVTTARNGDMKSALLRLRTLAEYSPQNQQLWIDYLTVLHWDENNDLAISLLDNVDLENAPDYFLDAMFNASRNIKNWPILLNIIQQYITRTDGDISPKYWEVFDETFNAQENGYAEQLLHILQQSPHISSANLYALITRYQQLGSSQAAVLEKELMLRKDSQAQRKKLWLAQQSQLNQNGKTELALAHLRQHTNDYSSHREFTNILKRQVANLRKSQSWQQALAAQEKLIATAPQTQNFQIWAAINTKIADINQRLKNYQQLQSLYPDNQWLRADTITALAQYSRDQPALHLLPRLNINTAPAYALEQAALAAKRQQQFQLALALYNQANVRFPNNIEFPLGKALCLIEQGDPLAGQSILQQLEKSHPQHSGIKHALGFSHNQQKQYASALLQYQKILQENPQDSTAYREMVMSILQLGSTGTAFKLALEQPQHFNPQHWRKLYADRAAIAIRWANLYEPNIEVLTSRLTLAKHYSTQYQQFLQQNSPYNARLTFNAKNDYLALLRLDKNYPAIINQYQLLSSMGFTLPAASHLTAAEAYLALKRADDALPVLQQLPSNSQEKLEQEYYAHLNLSDHQKAFATAQKLMHQNPVWLARDQSNYLAANPKRTQAELLQKLSPTYNNRLKESQLALEQFLSAGPANTDIRNHLAMIYRWRGWPRKAQQQLQLIKQVEPQFDAANINAIYTKIDLRDYQNIDNEIIALKKKHYKSPALKQLTTAWDLHQKASIQIQSSVAAGSGGAFASRDTSIQARVNSALFQQGLRLFSRAIHKTNKQSSKPHDTLDRLSLGLQWEQAPFYLSSEISQAFNGDNTGLGLSARWYYDDYWTLSSQLQSYSDETPIRAVAQGTKLHTATLSLRYAWNESRRSTLSFTAGKFSDGNQRTNIQLDNLFGLYRSASHLLDGRVHLGLQTNDSIDAVYFNPTGLSSLSTGLDYTGTLQQRYHTFFKHRASLDLGLQSQQGFGSGVVWGLRYTHLWQANQRLSWSYGASYSVSAFDGQTEQGHGLFAQLSWKF